MTFDNWLMLVLIIISAFLSWRYFLQVKEFRDNGDEFGYKVGIRLAQGAGIIYILDCLISWIR